MSDSRSCGRCIYYNSITNECGEESKCMRDVDEARYTSYIEGKKHGKADAIEEIIPKVIDLLIDADVVSEKNRITDTNWLREQLKENNND